MSIILKQTVLCLFSLELGLALAAERKVDLKPVRRKERFQADALGRGEIIPESPRRGLGA